MFAQAGLDNNILLIPFLLHGQLKDKDLATVGKVFESLQMADDAATGYGEPDYCFQFVA